MAELPVGSSMLMVNSSLPIKTLFNFFRRFFAFFLSLLSSARSLMFSICFFIRFITPSIVVMYPLLASPGSMLPILGIVIFANDDFITLTFKSSSFSTLKLFFTAGFFSNASRSDLWYPHSSFSQVIENIAIFPK